jgi:hypothetical protein
MKHSEFEPIKSPSWPHQSNSNKRWALYKNLISDKTPALIHRLESQSITAQDLSHSLSQSPTENANQLLTQNHTNCLTYSQTQPTSGDNYFGAHSFTSLSQTSTEHHYWIYATINSHSPTSTANPSQKQSLKLWQPPSSTPHPGSGPYYMPTRPQIKQTPTSSYDSKSIITPSQIKIRNSGYLVRPLFTASIHPLKRHGESMTLERRDAGGELLPAN